MKFIQRALEKQLFKKLKPNKVVILLGARRTGKTTFLRQMMEKMEGSFLLLNGEDITTVEILKRRSVEHYKRLLGKRKLLIVDEAQKIPEIGAILKLMVDEIKGLKIIASGSSAFDLSGKIGEPLTGRSFTLQMFPLSQLELSRVENLSQTAARLEERLVFGSYPEIGKYKGNDEKAEYLRELVNGYLLKDILTFDGIRNSGKMFDLLRLVAFQTGKEVSMEELGRQLGMSKNTAERYLDLLSKVFVIFKLKAFSGNPRKEISKSSKWYFFDNGIRNALIANFSPLSLRNDVGELWENYLISERIKCQHYKNHTVHNFFWRTYQHQEIDWVEQRDGKLFAYEMKWSNRKLPKAPSVWKELYPKSNFNPLNKDNYLGFILGERELENQNPNQKLPLK